MINRVIFAILFSFFCYQAGACNDSPLSIEIIESGLYDVEKIQSIPYPRVPSSSLTINAKAVHIKDTSNIPAILGNSLGYRYVVSGGHAGAPVVLTVVMKYPLPGITDPGTGMTHLQDRHVVPAIIGEIGTTFYSFDHDWELLPGEWTREIWHGCKKLASRTYQVTKLSTSAETNKSPKSAPALWASAGRPNLRSGRPLAWRYKAIELGQVSSTVAGVST